MSQEWIKNSEKRPDIPLVAKIGNFKVSWLPYKSNGFTMLSRGQRSLNPTHPTQYHDWWFFIQGSGPEPWWYIKFDVSCCNTCCNSWCNSWCNTSSLWTEVRTEGRCNTDVTDVTLMYQLLYQLLFMVVVEAENEAVWTCMSISKRSRSTKSVLWGVPTHTQH